MGLFYLPMKLSRKRYLIQPGFQARFILRFCLIVLFSTALTAGAALLVISHKEKTSGGTLYYITNQKGSGIVPMKKTDVVIPVLLISALANLSLACILGLLYSHRLAGPAYRLEKELKNLAQGNGANPITLRENDEFHPLAESFNNILKRIPKP